LFANAAAVQAVQTAHCVHDASSWKLDILNHHHYQHSLTAHLCYREENARTTL
jgi:hypothetical protein